MPDPAALASHSPAGPTSVAVYGTGSMGTAMAVHLERLGHAVTLWSRTAAKADRLAAERENRDLLPDIRLSRGIAVTADAAQAAAADWHLLAIPSKFLRDQLAGLPPPTGGVVTVIKGLEIDTLDRPSEIVRQTWGDRSVVCLSGPSHAEEIATGLPTSMVAASDHPGAADAVQRIFNSGRLRVYTNGDLTGVELAGALKNVFGLAAGICDGIGFGDNAKAALLTRAVAEMQRFGAAFGAAEDTFAGLAGIGDLIATCTSPHGRNRAVGVRLGRGEALEDILASMNGSVSEGVPTTRAVRELSRRHGLEMPIVEEVHAVLFEGKDVQTASASLMTRPLRSESASRL